MRFNQLSVYRKQLMGIATILICIFHGLSIYGYYPVEPNGFGKAFVSIFGSVGVEIFLILSGIGNYHSLLMNSSYKEFYHRKMLRLMPSVSFVCLSFWLYRYLVVESRGVTNFIFDVSGVSFWLSGERRYWYICLIILCYLVSPFLYSLNMRQKNLILILTMLFPVIYELTNYDLFALTEIATCRISSYVVGFIIGEKIKDDSQIHKQHVLGFALFCVFLLLLRFFHLKSVTRFCKLPLAIFICFTISALFCVVPIVYEKTKEGLAFIGKYSLEIYIVQVSLIWLCINYWNIDLTKEFNYLCLMIVTFGASMLVSAMSKAIIKTICLVHIKQSK